MIPLTLGLILYVLAQFNPSCRSLYYSNKANLIYSKKLAKEIQLIHDLNLAPASQNNKVLHTILKETLIKNTYSGEKLSYIELLKTQFHEMNSFAYYGDFPIMNDDLSQVSLRLNDTEKLKYFESEFNRLLELSRNETRSKEWSMDEIVHDLAEYYFETMNANILYNFNHEVFLTHVNYIAMSRYVHFYPINFSKKINPINDQSLKENVFKLEKDKFVEYFINVFKKVNPL